MTTPDARLRLDKDAFFDSLGYRPHPGQQAVHRSDASRRIVACGVRWGKTKCAAMEGLAAAMEPKDKSIGWVVAPTYDLADRVYREIVFIAAEHLRHRIEVMKENERRLVLRNLSGGLSEIRAKSADNPVSLLGEGLDWVVVDEAARLKPAIWQGHLSQRLLDKNGWALLISTPAGKGWLYELFLRGQGERDPDHESWNAPSAQNPHLDAALIEVERDRLPERVFRQEYMGEFIEGSGAVFRGIRECAIGELEEPKEDESYVAGVDLAKVADYTVLTIATRSPRRIVYFDRFNKIDWTSQIARIQGALDRYGNPPIFVDSTGAGEPVFEALHKAGCNALAYAFTSRSKGALIDNLVLRLERREIELLRGDVWPEAIEELEAFEYTVGETGNVRMNAPSGLHDDCVISIALAAWHPISEGGFDVSVVREPHRRPRRDLFARATDSEAELPPWLRD